MLRNGDLTRGGITGTLLRFTLPMMAGSLLQQCYNIADTLVVGQCIGADALAAVGSAYTLMVFLISILLGLSIGSGTVFSLHYGAGNHSALRRSIFVSFVLIGAVTCVLNIVLDLFFILQLDWGIEGAAIATVMAQGVASAGIVLYTWRKRPELRLHIGDMRFDRGSLKEIVSFSTLTCVQQSVMNFGILMIQGLVNSFGTAVMAAFAAAVKIDSFAYMPVQEFGNAFSTFIAQNFGAKRYGRIRRGVRSALLTTVIFSIIVSVLVFVFAEPLMLIFVHPGETEILATGVEYLRIEGAFYCGIGILFLLYGYYRAVRKPGMSVVLTVISLGTRVALSYLLAAIPSVGVTGIWWSIPIGWLLADAVGMLYYKMKNGA
jgi:Na+-driven multidrug efflux pump